MLGNFLCLFGFVVVRYVESDSERFNRTVALGLHQGNYGGGVNTTRKKGAKRNVSFHAQFDRVTQEILKGSNSFVLRNGQWFGDSAFCPAFAHQKGTGFGRKPASEPFNVSVHPGKSLKMPS